MQADDERIRTWLAAPEPQPILTDAEQRYFDTATICHICDRPLHMFKDEIGKDNPIWIDGKVADHDHVTGAYRGAAHNAHNLNYRIKAKDIEVSCFLHGMKNYDEHLVLGAVKARHGKMTCIPHNTEKYISFKVVGITFNDTFAFMPTSLEKLIANLNVDQLVNTRRYLEVSSEFQRRYQDDDSVDIDDDNMSIDSEDVAFIDDDDDVREAVSDDEDDERDVIEMAEAIERELVESSTDTDTAPSRTAPSRCYRFEDSSDDDEQDSDSNDDDAPLADRRLEELRIDLCDDGDDDDESYSDEMRRLLNQHEHLGDDCDGGDLEDMVRAAERSEDDYRHRPFKQPQLTVEEVTRVDNELTLMTRKGVYPYEYMSSFERFDETELPPRDAFFSSLKGKGIDDEDYAHAQTVWDAFDIKNMGDYHDFYLLTDVVLLADVMQAFRAMCLRHYKLDPWRYCTAPGLAWDAGLRMTGARLDLIANVDTHLFIEAGMRGGVSVISQRYAKASEEVDEDGRSDHLMYYDGNNLYGHAMVQHLPTGDFEMERDVQVTERQSGCHRRRN